MTPEEYAKVVMDEAALWYEEGWNGPGDLLPLVADAVRKAVQDEREACAVLLEDQGRLLKIMFETDRHQALIGDLAAAVRKRGHS